MEVIRSLSMVDKNELVERGVSGREEGVRGREDGGSGESELGTKYRTIVPGPVRISPLGRSFSAVRATADGGAGLAGDPKINIFTGQLLQIAHLAGDPKRKG